jgi:class 3 adenylate cyclase
VSQVVQDPVEAAHDAYRRHAWAEAYDLLAGLDAGGALGPEDLLLLAETAVLTGRVESYSRYLERAYTGFLDAGNRVRAGFVAILLAHDSGNRLQPAIAAGWRSRATRHLDEAPEAVEHGYLELERSLVAWKKRDFDGALEHARRAEEIGARHGDRDLEIRGLQRRGIALIERGDYEAGRELLDEASAAAVAGELNASSTVAVFCNTIGTCRDLADYARAGQWTETASDWCDAQSAAAFPGLCRVNRAEVMRVQGQWEAAERHAAQASEELKEWCPRVAGAAFYEIGEVRLRRGDLDGAEEAFREAHAYGRDPQPGLALVRLAQGRKDAAAAALAGALAENEMLLGRARLLPAQVEIAVQRGDERTARDAATELAEIAVTYGTSALEAAAVGARGSVELLEGNVPEAIATLKRAFRLWQEVGAPYEAAKVRLELGVAYQRAGNTEQAELELDAARAVFQRLGATLDAERASERATRRAKRTFMFTDIVRSTELLDFLGRDVWEGVVRKHDEIVRAAIADKAGEIVKTTGDGFFAVFRDADAAVGAATGIMRALRDNGSPVRLRIGLHCGEALEKEGDWEGEAVITASRLESAAEPGEILASCDTLAGVPVVAGARRSVRPRGLDRDVEAVPIDWQS